MSLLSVQQVHDNLAELEGWELGQDGKSIRRLATFSGFMDAVKFVDMVAEAAEAADHHPDIDIRWNTVTLVLSTHSEGGLTEKDFRLAAQIDELVMKATRQPY